MICLPLAKEERRDDSDHPSKPVRVSGATSYLAEQVAVGKAVANCSTIVPPNWRKDTRDFVFEDMSIPDQGLIATLRRRADHSPVRLLMAGRQRKRVGRYPSKKSGRGMPYESTAELLGFYEAETDTDTLDYYPQPHTLAMCRYGQWEWDFYTPDRVDVRADQSVQTVEMKGSRQFDVDPQYEAKLQLARLHYEAHGGKFLLRRQNEIESSPKYKVIEKIQAYRTTSITGLDLHLTRSLFAGRESITFQQIIDAYGNPALAFAKLSAMVVRRLVAVDLDGGDSRKRNLSPGASVRRIRL